MDDGIERMAARPAMPPREVHVSSRYPVLFFMLLVMLLMASVYVEGVSEGWWD